MWQTASYRNKLLILEGESTVMIELLLEHDSLVKMIRDGATKEACLDYINNNF